MQASLWLISLFKDSLIFLAGLPLCLWVNEILKSEIYLIGKELRVSNEILSAPPTDGLWKDNKTDEEQIGASYTELEWAMSFNRNESLLNQREKQVLKIYKNLNLKNQHKMIDIPVCIIPKGLK